MKNKLTDNQVIQLRAARSAGASQNELAREYGMSRQAIAAIVEGRTYRHLPMGDNPRQLPGQNHRAVTDEELRDIFRRWADGDSGPSICEHYGISAPVLSNYVHGLSKERPPGPEWERVEPHTGAKYRNALLKIARGHPDPQGLAHKALGLEE